MKPDEFLHEMLLLKEKCNDDEEQFHIDADNLLCNVLAELGYGDGIQIFQNMPKWYS